MVEKVFETNLSSCHRYYSISTYRSCNFDKGSHMTSVAYDRILGQFNVIDFLQFWNECIVETIQLVS